MEALQEIFHGRINYANTEQGTAPAMKEGCPSLCWRGNAGAGSRSSVMDKTFVKAFRWGKANKERNLFRGNSDPNLKQVVSSIQMVEIPSRCGALFL